MLQLSNMGLDVMELIVFPFKLQVYQNMAALTSLESNVDRDLAFALAV